jgi:hypothetical protein
VEPPAGGPGDPRVAKGHGSQVQVVVGVQVGQPGAHGEQVVLGDGDPDLGRDDRLATENELTVES